MKNCFIFIKYFNADHSQGQSRNFDQWNLIDHLYNLATFDIEQEKKNPD